MTASLSFSDFLHRELGTSRWCVSPRMTQRLKERGYTVAVSQKRYQELEEQWEREVYGAPLKQLHKAAPALLKALKRLMECPDLCLDEMEPETNAALEEAIEAVSDAGGWETTTAEGRGK